MKILLDSSVVIDYTRAGIGDLDNLLKLTRKNIVSLYIPMIVYSELWAGKSMSKKTEIIKHEKILSLFVPVDFTVEVAKKTGELIRSEKINGFDALIAASAICNDLTLATSNKKHFEKVPNLKIYNSKVKIKSEKKYKMS